MEKILPNSENQVNSVHKTRNTAETALKKRKKKTGKKSGNAILTLYGLTSTFMPETMLNPVIMPTGVRMKNEVDRK